VDQGIKGDFWIAATARTLGRTVMSQFPPANSITGGFQRLLPGERGSQNFVTSVKLKSFTFIAGTTMSKDSSPLARTRRPIDSMLDNM
jgi:hypothetical protein